MLSYTWYAHTEQIDLQNPSNTALGFYFHVVEFCAFTNTMSSHHKDKTCLQT